MGTKAVVLVVDPDHSTRRFVSALLLTLGYEVDEVESGEQALVRLATASAPAVILLDLILPGMSGPQVLDRIHLDHPEIPVLVLSTEAQIKTVVDAVRRGAADYLTKPLEARELELSLQNVLVKRAPREDARILKGRFDRGNPVSSNSRMLRIQEIARQVADTDAPVLLLGESGVGKEVLARYVHAQSRHARQPFVKVNCAALPHDLLESELFGYEKGAFSGAFREKPGMFELADNGSLLLDEIGEMSPSLQAKLLHVLQDGDYTRLGGTQRLHANARVLASTNIKLEEAVMAGRFRQDLYFRLNVIRIDIPPLRDRRDDIPMLCAHFLQTYGARYRSTVRELPRELVDAFMRYDWPGNVRELENSVRRYVILPDMSTALSCLATDGWRTEQPVAVEVPKPAAAHREKGIRQGVSLRKVGAQAAEEAERQLLRRALTETRWNRKAAATMLHISYKGLLNKLKKWEVDELGGASGPPTPVSDGQDLAASERLWKPRVAAGSTTSS